MNPTVITKKRWLAQVEGGRFLCRMGGGWGPSYVSTEKPTKKCLFRSEEHARSVLKLWHGGETNPNDKVIPVKVTLTIELEW